MLKLTRDLKIDPKYVRTTRVNVQPEYNWDNNARERNLIGYYVSRQVEVDLRDLEKLGQLLERSFDLGVNQVGDPRLDSSKRRELEREALAKAVADARLNAEAVAQGRRRAPRPAAHDLRELRTSSPPPMPMVQARWRWKPKPATRRRRIRAARWRSTATVQVEYDLIPRT